MRAWLLGCFFAVLAVIFWDDEGFRRLNLLMANVWWAAAYIASRRAA